MATLAVRLADRLLSTFVPQVEAEAVDCWYAGSQCVRCATYKARLYDYYHCSDGSIRRIDFGCDSC